jgi:hypothetical protein
VEAVAHETELELEELQHAPELEAVEYEPELEAAIVAPVDEVPEQDDRGVEETLDGSLFQVVVRLTSGERVVVAEVSEQDAAAEVARTFIRDLAGKDAGDWPLVAGRFLRPDTILSVDIAEPGA